jgi:hypothetical protein
VNDRDHPHDSVDDLDGAAAWLRAQRPRPTKAELDLIKQRSIVRTVKRPEPIVTKGRRWAASAVAVGSLALGIGGAFALAAKQPPGPIVSAGNSSGSSSEEQYKPGKGCGDKNHEHEREDECKKPPK